MLRTVIVFAVLLCCGLPAAAQECSPLRVVVGLAAGGGTDAVARLLAQRLTERFGRTVIVENRVGASGNIAAEFVAKAPRDGCTLILRGSEHHTNPHMYSRPGYGVKDFVPVSRVLFGPTVVLAGAGQPFKTLAGLVEYGKANPGKLSYGSSGVGGTTHVAMELFSKTAGIELVHIPYKGGAPSLTDGAAGIIPLVNASVAAAMPFITAGKLVPLSVSTPNRWSALPQVPTLIETGYPQATLVYWMGLLAPAGTPLALREKLNQDVRAILDEPAIRERLAAQGYDAAGVPIAEFEKFLEQDERVNRKLVQDLNLKLD